MVSGNDTADEMTPLVAGKDWRKWREFLESSSFMKVTLHENKPENCTLPVSVEPPFLFETLFSVNLSRIPPKEPSIPTRMKAAKSSTAL